MISLFPFLVLSFVIEQFRIMGLAIVKQNLIKHLCMFCVNVKGRRQKRERKLDRLSKKNEFLRQCYFKVVNKP